MQPPDAMTKTQLEVEPWLVKSHHPKHFPQKLKSKCAVICTRVSTPDQHSETQLHDLR